VWSSDGTDFLYFMSPHICVGKIYKIIKYKIKIEITLYFGVKM
jgi:hypothetical protein